MVPKIKDKNVLFITLDSCRFDTIRQADVPNIKSIGKIRPAYTHGSYTVPAHIAFFSGHLPAVLEKPLKNYYSETKSQLWRIETGKSYDSKKFGILFEENNILEGYRKLGYFVFGVGGVTQFSENSLLRSYFGKNFLYFGENLNEEPLKSRRKSQFPLNHINEIILKLKNKDKWFLFINCPETHYPYDCGNGIPSKIKKSFSELKKYLNLRENNFNISNSQKLSSSLKLMQKEAIESIDKNLETLFEKLPKKRNILVVICGDHGENFGEIFANKQRWGHLFPSKEVMCVPLVIGEIHGNN